MQELEKYKDIPDEPIDESAGLSAEDLEDFANELPDDTPIAELAEETPEGSEESLKDSPVVQFLAGAAIGGLQGWIPFGIVGNAVNMPTKHSELGRGVGEAAMGVAQIVGGLGAIIGGGGAAAGGVVAAPVTGGASVLVTLAGGRVVACRRRRRGSRSHEPHCRDQLDPALDVDARPRTRGDSSQLAPGQSAGQRPPSV